MWTLEQRRAVEDLVSGRTPHDAALREALEEFCSARGDARRKDCAQAMSSVPRDTEHAADYAAKAEVYDDFLAELGREIERA